MYVVCRRAIASLYGFTPYKIDLTAQVLKQNFNSSIISHRSYSNETVFNMTFNETQAIFESNVEDADNCMAVSALTPSSDLQHEAVIWMDNYFHLYGDKIPTILQRFQNSKFKKPGFSPNLNFVKYCLRGLFGL